MGLPSQKRTKSSKKRRASHFSLRRVKLTKCQHCGQLVRPHHVCSNCGYYKGREVIKKLTKLDKKSKRKEEKTK